MKTYTQAQASQQHGAAILTLTLVILVAMTLMTAIGARVAVYSQRVATNTVHTDGAFQAADGAVDNLLAYLNHNKAYVASTATDGWFNAGSSPKWTDCDAADTAVPCGDGSANLYGSDWTRYGPVPNLQAVAGNYATPVHLLSDNINDPVIDEVWLDCLTLSLTSVVPSTTVPKIAEINALLNQIVPGLGLPANVCLPLNFDGADRPPPPSSSNPTLRAVAYSSNSADVRGGEAIVQQDFQTVSRFAWDPMAPLMVMGTPHLNDDIRVWGNPRPPSRPPYDWSILDLNDIAGLDVSTMIDVKLNGGHAATLAPLLNMSVADVLALNWNATFPLSIWSDESTQLKSGAVGPSILTGPRTCTPQFDSVATSTCLPLSLSVSFPPDSIAPGVPPIDTGLHIKLPDIQDEHNVLSTAAGLIDTSPLVNFPDDIFLHTFGIPQTEAADMKTDAVVMGNCNTLETQPGGFYWVTGNCSINGIAGSAEDPMLLITEGRLTLNGGSEFWGVAVMLGDSSRRIVGDINGLRPTFFGAVVSTNTLHLTKNMNIVYDRDVIRRAGYRAGHFTRLPGGWTDEASGP